MMTIQDNPPAQYYRELAQRAKSEGFESCKMTFQYLQTFRRKFFAFVEKVEDIRNLQKEYISGRDQYVLLKIRDGERELDAIIESIKKGEYV
jgi:hypothetical protein